jgi:predicted phosphodiesterase
MRLAALYDIHGNLPALEAVIEDIYREKVDCIVVGGDVVAGPMPRETLTLLQEGTIPTHFIHGNAESEVLQDS